MKELEIDDPMELQGVQCDGDPDYMIECVTEEYMRMGWPPEQILPLFESPFYPLLHQLMQARGVEAIRRSIEGVAARSGVFRFRTLEAPESPELVQITSLRQGGRHDE